MSIIEEIKVGSVVYLKSGSEAMVVEEIENNVATCVWHDKTKPMEAKYMVSSLTTQQPNAGNTPLGISRG